MARKFVPHPALATRRLRLRQFRAEDTDGMHQCLSDPEAMRFWNHPAHTRLIETERAVMRWIDCTPAYYRFWAIADAKTDRCMGMVNYHDGHIRNKRIAIGYIVNPAVQRKGIATEAVTTMLEFCFGELGLHRAQAFIHPDNKASRKLVEKLGFRREGLLRGNLRVGEEWRDDVLYALVAAERPIARPAAPS